MSMRYALYFAPEPHSLWWDAGCRWLGRDPLTTAELPQVRLPDVHPRVLHTLTRDARRYGFHATLKAPFRLADGHSLSTLENLLQQFTAQRAPVTVPSPRVSLLRQFLAILPDEPQDEINRLAMDCVREFDHLRAPLTPDELARRQRQQLSARQLRLLSHWGYPYTEEEYQFHITLSDSLHNTDSADAIVAAAQRFFAISEPLVIRSIALFTEAGPGADFMLHRHFRFGG